MSIPNLSENIESKGDNCDAEQKLCRVEKANAESEGRAAWLPLSHHFAPSFRVQPQIPVIHPQKFRRSIADKGEEQIVVAISSGELNFRAVTKGDVACNP